MQIFTPFVRALGSALSLHHQRHQVLTENVANAETPGYRARDLEFGHVLESAFAEGQQPRPVDGEAEPTIDRHAVVKIDRNSVDLDTEMARMSENALKIVALSQFVAGSYAGLKTAIGEIR
jgi:flagellar basal-body rod protein FlgB